MENNKHHPHHGNNGFILGVIVGVALTLLFVTKRGRKILKIITDEGQEKFSDLEEILKEKKDSAKQSIDSAKEGIQSIASIVEDPEGIMGDDYIDTNGVQERALSNPQHKKASHTNRRFFKGVSKKHN